MLVGGFIAVQAQNCPVLAPTYPKGLMGVLNLSLVRPNHPLLNPVFRRLWLGMIISMAGDQFYFIALPWVALRLTGSALTMSTILMVSAIPRAVLMLVGGALSDHVLPRKIMMYTATVRACLVATIGMLIALDHLHVWQLYLFAFIFGVADAFAMPAGGRYLPSLVEPENILHANSVLDASAGTVSLIGPAPAALVVKTLGVASAFFLNSLCFFLIIATLWSLPDPPLSPDNVKPTVWHSIVEGVRYIRLDAVLFSIIPIAMIFNVCLEGPILVGLPYMASNTFHSPTTFAILLSSFAAGGILGSLVASVFQSYRKDRLLLGCMAFVGLCLGSAGMVQKLWLICGVLLVMGVVGGVLNLHVLAWVQRRVNPGFRGRVMSLLMCGSMGLNPLAIAIAGVLAQWSLRWMFILAGTTLLLTSIVSAQLRAVRELRSI